jgi:predicted permease
MARFKRLFRFPWRTPQQIDDDVDTEVQFHLEMRTQELIDDGLTPAAAASEARRQFGDLKGTHVRLREADRRAERGSRRFMFLDDVRHDLIYGVRTLARSPGFAAVAVLTLALGIGANVALFSLVNSLMLRSLPVRDPHQLVTVTSPTAIGMGYPDGAFWSYPMWERFQRGDETFAGKFAWLQQRFDLSDGGEKQHVNGVFATGEFFATLGVRPVLGRLFGSADDVRGGGPDGPVAVIGHGLWTRRWGGSPDVIGSSLSIDGVPFTIIGVTPREFLGIEVGQSFDVALPLATQPLVTGNDAGLGDQFMVLRIMLRLQPGQSIDAGAAVLRSRQPQILGVAREDLANSQLPAFVREPFMLMPAATGASDLRRQYQRPLVTVLAIVGLVLLLTCTNIGNLLLARGSTRRQELRVRLALGGSRWRIVRLLFTESVVLAACGAAVGLVVATWTSRVLIRLLETDTPVILDLGFDGRVVAFTIGLSFVVALVFGLIPALHSLRAAERDGMREVGRGISASQTRTSAGLLVAQIAISLVLVVVAGLFVRTFAHLISLPLGFDRDRVLLADVDATRSAVDPEQRLVLYERLVDTIRDVPGVEGASVSWVTPIAGRVSSPLYEPDAPDAQQVVGNSIAPGWFATYGILILRGRDFDTRDSVDAPAVTIVNEAFLRRDRSGDIDLGDTIVVEGGAGYRGTTREATIVGVVGNAAYSSLRAVMPPTLYVPLAQQSLVGPTLSISPRASSANPALLVPSVAGVLSDVDRDLRFTFRTLAHQVNTSIAQDRVLALLAGFFGTLALVLAAVGLYGVTSYGANQRQRELGIRAALGATPHDLSRLVLARVGRSLAVGVIVGVAVSLWAGRFVSTLLYGLEPHDPVTLAGAVGILVGVAVASEWMPARRAARVDPVTVLRAE